LFKKSKLSCSLIFISFKRKENIMLVDGTHYKTIWLKDNHNIQVIDQRKLPFYFEIKDLFSVADTYNAIKQMIVRGAPLIGVTASFGMYLATLENRNINNWLDGIQKAGDYLKSSRPTAVNLSFAVDQQINKLKKAQSSEQAIEIARNTALELSDAETENCRRIGEYGLPIIREVAKQKRGEPVNILTHCNAGWLACIDYGTATAPVYLAHNEGIDLHIWVDETRPRNQGARLTAWELGQHGIAHTVIPDNTGGLLMQRGMVDMVITGSDRAAANGDVANKIGTYLKALAAYDNNVPFYVALPLSTIDLNIENGIKDIPIEQRDKTEITHLEGISNHGIQQIRITPKNSNVANYGFDITPAKYVNALITDKGVCKPNKREIKKLFGNE
jgi:methylthioribose-1-phosphate isomerase